MKKKEILKNVGLGTVGIVSAATLAAFGAIVVGINCYGIYSFLFDSSLSIYDYIIGGGMLACIDLGCATCISEFIDANKIRKSINSEDDIKNTSEVKENLEELNTDKKLEKQLTKTYDINPIIDGQISLFENYDNRKEKNKVKVLKR